MQKLSIFFLLLIYVAACSQKKMKFDDYTASIKDFQFNMNKDFSDVKISPLAKDELKKFKGLDFFPIDSTYKVMAKFELDNDPRLFKMPTTTDRAPLYKTFGIARFTLDGKELTLHIYQNQELIKEEEYKDHLFIPFTDITNGNESYGGGRYIDLEIPKGDRILIDFNKSYNPYCVYNDKYSCPIPPRENNLLVAIKAGVKTYEK